MIHFALGDIFDSKTEAIVNPVNCVGVMGKGLAVRFKNAFPDNFHAYKRACSEGKVSPGCLFTYDRAFVKFHRFVVNFPTKRHWRDSSLIEDVEAGLVDLIRVIQEYDITSISVPALGCGLGGLDWTEVSTLIVAYLGSLTEIEVKVYPPK